MAANLWRNVTLCAGFVLCLTAAPVLAQVIEPEALQRKEGPDCWPLLRLAWEVAHPWFVFGRDSLWWSETAFCHCQQRASKLICGLSLASIRIG